MHDPFAMRPFFGYNFGHYIDHWLSMERRVDAKLPKIFHVNWFGKSPSGTFLWPGYGENIRVLEWIFRRLDGTTGVMPSAVGYLPTVGALNLSGLNVSVNLDKLFELSKHFWEKEILSIRLYFEQEVNEDLPVEMKRQLEMLTRRVQQL